MPSSPTTEDQLSIPVRYCAISGACPGLLTPPSMCIHLNAASKACRCTLRLRQSRVGHWMDPKQPSSLLSIPAMNCIHPRACKISAPTPHTHTHTQTALAPPTRPLLSTFDTSVFKPHLSLGNRGPLNGLVFIHSTSLMYLPCSSNRVSLVHSLVHLNVVCA